MTDDAPVPRLLTLPEAAAQLGVTEAAIRSDRSHRAYKLVPVDAYVKFGATVRIRADRLAEHVERHTVPTPVPVPLRLAPPAPRRRRKSG